MQQANQETKVWDIAVRLFHWTLVLAFCVTYLTEDDFEWLHVNAGYVIAGLLVFRLVWGVIGTRYARFSDFIYRPSKVIEYIRLAGQFKAPRHLGHNPAGGAMVIALLVMLTITTLSGIALYGIVEQAGPMAGVFSYSHYAVLFEEIHEISSNLTLVLIFLHIVGVLYSSIEHGEDLARAMITGKKRSPD